MSGAWFLGDKLTPWSPSDQQSGSMIVAPRNIPDERHRRAIMVDFPLQLAELYKDIYDFLWSSDIANGPLASVASRLMLISMRFFGELRITDEITPTEWLDSLSFEYLFDILSDFPSSDDRLAMKVCSKRPGLSVMTLIRWLEIHGHLRHQETIFDPLELFENESKNVLD